MSISDNIKIYREKQGLSQRALAEKLGISQAAVSQFENGKNPPKIDTLQKIANALDVDINSLLEDTDSPLVRAVNRSGESSALFDSIKQSHLTKSIQFKNIDIELIKLFHQLNSKGKEKVIDYTFDLTNNPDYQSTP